MGAFIAKTDIPVGGVNAYTRGQRVEADAHLGPTTADVAGVVFFAAVIRKRRQADQGGNGLACALAEFGQVHQEDPGNLGPMPTMDCRMSSLALRIP